MTVVLPTPEPALVARFASGDENALMTLYRHEYDGMLDMAREELGPELEHYRGKVAHQAMLDAWESHERFQNPTALAAFLEEAVRHEAQVQHRKHATLHHRHGQVKSHVSVATVDEAVQSLMQALHTPVDHQAAVEEARAAKRAHAKEHVERVVDRPRWLMYGLFAIAGALVIIYGQRLLDRVGGDSAVDTALKSGETQVLSSGNGQRGALTLRDGTRTTMGSATRLRVPAAFGNSLRTIELEGTATFAVDPNATNPRGLPFAVRTGGMTLTARGTVFTVRHFPGEAGSVLEVTEGTVELRNRETGKTEDLVAGRAVRYTPDGQILTLDSLARDVALAWTRDSIVFANTPLRVAVPELVRWFGINAAIADNSVLDRPVSMRVGLTSSGDATSALTQAAGLMIQFGKNDRIEFVSSPPPVTKATISR
ncbi:MAG: FecR domain-containing protein [Gemmatimonadaceae bacterium]|nr:FecR domain-containing protein [Gemmatimonadaceae bacterium]